MTSNYITTLLTIGLVAMPMLLQGCTPMAGSTHAHISTNVVKPEPDVTPPEAPPKPEELLARDRERLKKLQNTVYTPPHIDQEASWDMVRIAVLLPFSSGNDGVRHEAEALLAAIQLALFRSEAKNVVLLPKDTGGNPKMALAAAQTAIEEGAVAFIGPLFADNVRAIAKLARQHEVPILSFSTDTSIAGDSIYLLSLSLEDEVNRIVDWAVVEGINRLVMFGPRTAYGKRVEAALRERAALHRVPVAAVQYYERSDSSPMTEARELAQIINEMVGSAADRALLKAEEPENSEENTASEEAETAEPLPAETITANIDPFDPEDMQIEAMPDNFEESTVLDNGMPADFDDGQSAIEPEEPVDFSALFGDVNPGDVFADNDNTARIESGVENVAILIPEGGLRLRAVAPLLPYHDVDLSKVRLLGTGLWNDPDVWREPTLIGGIFAAPDPKSIAKFRRSYIEVEKNSPGRLSGLGYDAGIVAFQLASIRRLDKAALERNEGFWGANGVFRLRSDGSTEHGLAVLRVTRRGGAAIVNKALESFVSTPFVPDTEIDQEQNTKY